MTDNPVMTKWQLEKAGYEFGKSESLISGNHWKTVKYAVHGGEWKLQAQNQGEPGMQECLQAATAHYRQQEELARLRRVVQGVYESASFMKANCLTVQDWPKIALDIDVLYGWMQDVCDDLNIKKWDKPAISEGEAK